MIIPYPGRVVFRNQIRRPRIKIITIIMIHIIYAPNIIIKICVQHCWNARVRDADDYHNIII